METFEQSKEVVMRNQNIKPNKMQSAVIVG